MQDRLTYANGNTITTEGFRCSVGEPIDIKVTVGEDEEVDLGNAAGKIIPNGDHLITLEVNGEKAAYRDLYHLGGDTVTVGDYTISDDMYLYGVSEDDEVVMRFEPVELMVTDTFRAAVKSLGGAASESSGGGSGGGVLVVSLVTSGTELYSGTLPNVSGYAWRSTIVGHTESYYVDFACDLSGATYNELSAVIGDVRIKPMNISYSDGTVTLKVGTDSGLEPGYTSEEEIAGKTLVLYADARTRLDKTWQEINDAGFSVLNDDGLICLLSVCGPNSDASAYLVNYIDISDGAKGFTYYTFSASTASDYPVRIYE